MAWEEDRTSYGNNTPVYDKQTCTVVCRGPCESWCVCVCASVYLWPGRSLTLRLSGPSCQPSQREGRAGIEAVRKEQLRYLWMARGACASSNRAGAWEELLFRGFLGLKWVGIGDGRRSWHQLCRTTGGQRAKASEPESQRAREPKSGGSPRLHDTRQG